MLKNAATVAAHHYAISDASGRSVVVEYVDNQMEVVESPAMPEDAMKKIGAA